MKSFHIIKIKQLVSYGAFQLHYKLNSKLKETHTCIYVHLFFCKSTNQTFRTCMKIQVTIPNQSLRITPNKLNSNLNYLSNNFRGWQTVHFSQCRCTCVRCVGGFRLRTRTQHLIHVQYSTLHFRCSLRGISATCFMQQSTWFSGRGS